MENWLSTAAAVFLVGMILYGHYRGLIRLLVSALTLSATVCLVHVSVPYVTGFLKENTGVYEMIAENMGKMAENAVGMVAGQPAQQRKVIEDLAVPKQLKSSLLENNNNEIYRLLGASDFGEYLSRYLADSVIRLISFLILFVLIFAGIRMITVWLDLVSRLPLISGANKIAGAALGGAEGVVFLWIAGLFIMIFAGTEGGGRLLQQIYNSSWLSYLYEHNLLLSVVMGVAGGGI